MVYVLNFGDIENYNCPIDKIICNKPSLIKLSKHYSLDIISRERFYKKTYIKNTIIYHIDKYDTDIKSKEFYYINDEF